MPSHLSSLDDVIAGYRWLGHREWTELNAYHPEYKPGKENFAWNKEHNAFPRVWYARDERDVVDFVRRYGDSRTVCHSLNPRAVICKTNGYVRSAREDEIEISQNALFDFDFRGQLTQARWDAFEGFTSKANTFFLDQRLKGPVLAFTGRGYHYLFAYPRVSVSDVPDIAERLRQFRESFYDAFRQELAGLECKLDQTHDLRRMVKIYGTAKPEVGIVSRFYGNERIEDEALRDYLLCMNISRPRRSTNTLVVGQQELPDWFTELLSQNGQIRTLWEGAGKGQGDQSGSGYDYVLTRELIALGYRNIDDLGAILKLRPKGSVQQHGKGEYYVKRTIAQALVR